MEETDAESTPDVPPKCAVCGRPAPSDVELCTPCISAGTAVADAWNAFYAGAKPPGDTH